MALFNHATKEVTAKVVYYGPGLCGKTTNLQWIHDNLSFKTKGKLVSLATQTDRTLFFDFLPLELGTIRGMRTRMQIYTVPGQVFYEATRRMVLKGCDAVVFVADSQAAMLDANAESQRSLRQNLLVNELDPEIPQVIQYNKRDLPTALPVSVLNERLNPRGLPHFEAVAFKGTGVEQTLKGVTKLLFQWLSRYYGEGAGEAVSAAAAAEPTPPKGDAPRVMIRVPHAALGSEPAPAGRPAAPPAPAPAPPPAALRPPTAPPSPPASPRPAAPAAPSDDEPAPTIRVVQQPKAPVARTSPPPPTAPVAGASSAAPPSRHPVPPNVPPAAPASAHRPPSPQPVVAPPPPQPVVPPPPQPVLAPPPQPVLAPPLQPVVAPPLQPVVAPPPKPVVAPPPKPVVAPLPRPVVASPPQPVLAPPPQPMKVPPAAAPAQSTAPPAAPRAAAPPSSATAHVTPAPARVAQPPAGAAPPARLVPPVPVVPAAPPASARPSGSAAPPPEELPATIVFKAQPSQPSAARPTPAEVPLFIDEEEEAAASTIVFATPAERGTPGSDESDQLVVVEEEPPQPPPPPPTRAAAPPTAVPVAQAAKPQPVVVAGAPSRPTTVNLPPGMSAPVPQPAVAKAAQAKPPAAPAAKPAGLSDPPPRGEGLRQDQWLYLLDGSQRGPIDVEDLIDLVLTSIPENTKVWHPGLEGWVLASQAREIAEEIPPPVPVPGLARSTYGDEEMPDFNTVPPMLRSVLIADEDAAFRKYLAMPLAAQGFTIYEAADGSAAWQLAVQNRPWMILADISMPELDGFEFCRRVRNHPMLQRMPLLFISGSDKYKERYRALQIGADDFLSKNMPVRELLMRIQLLMTRYSDLSASEPKAGAEDVAGAFQGRIEVFGAPALLQMCAQGRLTGLFTSLAEDAHKTATVIGFREGDVISATVGDVSGAEGVYAFLAWTKGSFKFTPGDPGEGEPLAQSVEHLLLEGCRLLDESQKDGAGDGASFA